MNRTITQLIILARTFADELESLLSKTVTEPGETAAPAPRRGRPKKEEAAAMSEPEKEPEKEKPAADEAKGMTLEQLKALIKPAVDAAAGLAVKEIIKKHGGTQLSDIPAANHAAFAADIEAMVY
jgi:hypothetical protein